MIQQNNTGQFGHDLPQETAAFIDCMAAASAANLLSAFFDLEPTPLVRLPALASQLGIGELLVKDESTRLGLGSFKPMGGAYAVLRLIKELAEKSVGRALSPRDLLRDDIQALAGGITVCCATDGNHGRAVALGARMAGCRAIIFLHGGVSNAREQAIQALGAETVRAPGTYDDSVQQAAAAATEHGWITITDTSWPSNMRVPSLVMQGYATIAAEVDHAGPPPTHIFLQAGVGGFAASIAGYFATRYGDRRPTVIVVEPRRAACLFRSNHLRQLVNAPADQPTIMSMLDCRTPSLIAWEILSRTGDYFMTVDEQDAIDAMRQFAAPVGDDPPIVSGESGCVGLAGLQAVIVNASREEIGLSRQSRVLLFNTEGATDPELYATLIGRSAQEVLAEQ